MKFRFELREPSPDDEPSIHGGVDWLERRRESERQRGVGSTVLYFVLEDSSVAGSDLYEQQITQDGSIIHLTRDYPDDPLDHIGIHDKRDNDWFSFFRGNTPYFPELIECLVPFSTVIITPEPTPSIVEVYQEQEAVGITELDEIILAWNEDTEL